MSSNHKYANIMPGKKHIADPLNTSDLDYTNVKGIWSLNATTQFPKVPLDVSLAGVQIVKGTSGSTINLTYPSGILENDIIIITGTHDGVVTVSSPPVGFTDQYSSAYYVNFTKIATGSETGSFSFTLSGNSSGWVYAVQVYRTTRPYTSFQFVSQLDAFVASGGNARVTAQANIAGKKNLFLYHLYAFVGSNTITSTTSNLSAAGIVTAPLGAFYCAKDIGEQLTGVTSSSSNLNYRLALYTIEG